MPATTRQIADALPLLPDYIGLTNDIEALLDGLGYTLTSESERLGAGQDGGPSLVLSAANTGTLLTFDRATIGQYFNASGVRSTAAIDALRYAYRYNGSGWVAAGFLLERAATQYATRSNNFTGTPWSGSATVTAAAATGADGTPSLSKLEDTSNAATHDKAATFALQSGYNTVSVDVSAGTSYGSLRLSPAGGTTPDAELVFDIANKTAQWRTSASGSAWYARDLGGGRVRYSIVINNTGGDTTVSVSLRPAFAATYSPTIDATAMGYTYFGAIMVEAGAVPTSHITTNNQFLGSEDLTNAVWQKVSVATLANQAADGAGNTTMTRITGVDTSNRVNNATAVPVTSGGTYTIEMDLKRSNFDWVRILVSDAVLFTNRVNIWFNINTGAVGTTSTAGSGWSHTGTPTITATATADVWRIKFSVVTGAATLFMGINDASADAATTRPNVGSGAGVGTIYLAGRMQLYAGTTNPGYNKVETDGTVVRAADVLNHPLSSRIDRVSMTGLFKVRLLPGSTGGTLWQWDDGGDDDRVTVRMNGTNIIMEVVVDDVVLHTVTGPTYAADTDYLIGATWEMITGAMVLRVNGTSYTGTAPRIKRPTRRRIGCNAAGGDQPNGMIEPWLPRSTMTSLNASEFIRALTAAELAMYA
jgi:hypothetical protein